MSAELTEKLFGFFEKRATHGIDSVIAKFAELVELGLLFGVEFCWNLDDDTDMEITVAVALDVFHPFAAKSKDCAGLSAGWDVDACLASECGYFDL